MTELFLIVSVCAAGLGFVAFLARWATELSGGGSDVQRLIAAVNRASESLFARQLKGGAWVAALLLPLLPAIVFQSSPEPFGSWRAALLAGASFAAGFAAAAGFGYFSTRLLVQNVPRVHDATKRNLGGSASIALRAGTASAVLIETGALLTLCLELGVAYALYGNGSSPSAETLRLVVAGVPPLAAGSAVAAISFQLTQLAYGTAATLGGNSATRIADVPGDDARNPALVSDLVARQVGRGLCTATDAFCVSLIGHAAVLLALTEIVRTGPVPTGSSVVGLLCLPLLARGLGLVGAAFGSLSAQTAETELPLAALWRAHASSAAIACGGLVGASIWCVGGEGWKALASAGSIGIVSAVLVLQLGRYPMLPGGHPLAPGATEGPAPGIASIRGGLLSMLGPALVLCLGLGLAYDAGTQSGFAAGGLLGTVMFVSGALALAPIGTAIAGFAVVADGTQGLGAFVKQDRGTEAGRRVAQLGDAGVVARNVAFTYSCSVSTLLLLLGNSLILGGFKGGPEMSLILGGAALVGSAFVLFHCGRTLRQTERAAAEVSRDVERQLFAAKSGGALADGSFTPNYQDCTDAAERVASAGTAELVWSALGAPIVVAFALRFALGDSRPVQQLALVSFCLAAGLSAATLALGLETARNVLCRRRPVGDGATLGGTHSVFSRLSLVSGAPAQSFVHATAAACLLVAPILN